MRFLRVSALLFVAGALQCVFAEEAQVEPGAGTSSNQFVVALVDGSRLVCTPLLKAIPLKTSFASVDIPLEKIVAVAFDNEHKEASIRLVNGDQIKGEIQLATLKIKTVIGEFSVAMKDIEQITGRSSDKAGDKKYSDSPAKKSRCINNLRMIDSAKEQWALASRGNDGAEVDVAGMVQYIKGSALPKCAAGGTYKVNVIGKEPECTVPGHKMHNME